MNLYEHISQLRARLLEDGLAAAFKRHLGCIPPPEQLQASGQCLVLPDGTERYTWNGEEIYRFKFSLKPCSKP